MSGHQAFLQQFQLKTANMGWSRAEQRRQLARFAIRTRDRLIAEGRASESYETFVNGRAGALEEEVRLPGPILYRFEYLGKAAAVGLDLLRAMAPVLSGRYREHFFALADGRPVQTLSNLPLDSEVILTNDEPYSRKIQVGGQKTSVPPYLFDRAGKALQRQFGDLIYVKVKFIRLHGGYILRQHGYRRGKDKPRPDVRAGDEMTYPALLLTRQF